MNFFLTMLALVAFVLLVVFLLALLGLQLYRRSRARRAAEPAPAAPSPAAAPAVALKEVHFRMQGERPGGVVHGDVLCADGVYVPEVLEAGLHTSFDGRWIRTAALDQTPARLVDRKTRRSWLLSAAEMAALDVERWRLPRWREEAARAPGTPEASQGAFSDGAFEAWLQEHVQAAAQDLVAVRDLWVPADQMPADDQALPALTQPDNPPVPLAIQRHWPASLRAQRRPMEAVRRPRWKLMFGEQPQPWAVDLDTQLIWREDGQAFAFYGTSTMASEYTPPTCLVVWSVQYGWQHWLDSVPTDRKPWALHWSLPQAGESETQAALRWEDEVLLQRVHIDTPQLERLHDGRRIKGAAAPMDGIAAHGRDGQVRLQPVPGTALYWRRHLNQPTAWQAQSLPVAGQPLCWTLVKEAADEPGATAAYALQWGETKLSGLWELEHLPLLGRGVALLQHGASPFTGERSTLQLWDGRQLQALALPWPVVRLRAVPASHGGQALRVQVAALMGCSADDQSEKDTGSWRWAMQPATLSSLGRDDWSACYAWRDLAPDTQGRWAVLPRWREVDTVQHPCADGDYVWRLHQFQDALWWSGGLQAQGGAQVQADQPRTEGLSVTRSGAVLCGTGPSACPHPGGEGWVVLELVALEAQEAHRWMLHWVQPGMREVHSLALRARMPVLHSWDGGGLHWFDQGGNAAAGTGQRQTVAWPQWITAQVEALYEGPGGLWLRKQDLRYADALLARDDWPWQRLRTEATVRV